MLTSISRRAQDANVGAARRAGRRPSAVEYLRGPALLALVVLLGTGCANIVAQNAPGALRTAENRARFELNCPNVTASILSQKIVQGFRFEGSEHTIGVRGCGKEAVYVTYCSDANDCNALAQTGRTNAVGGMMP